MKAEFKEACKQLLNLIDKSKGSFISVKDEKIKFNQEKTYSQTELNEFELAHKTKLPEDYKYFLMNVGISSLYQREFTNGVQFRKIEEIERYSKELFEDMDKLFPQLFLIGHLSGGEEIGFNLAKEMTENFLVFFPDEEIEDWPENEGREWPTFEDWLINVVKHNGEKMIM